METFRIKKHAARGAKLLAGLAAIALTMQSRATILSLNPASQDVNIGDSVDISLQIAGLGNGTAPSLGAFDVTLNFAPSILTFDSLAFGAGLGLSDNGSTLDSTLGTLNLVSVSFEAPADLDSAQPPDFVLATLHFSATGAGTSPLTLTDVLLSDALGSPLDASIVGGAVTVHSSQQVPEGGDISALFFLSVIGLVAANGHKTRELLR